MSTALLDGDVIAYKAAALCQEEIIWDEGDDPDIDIDYKRGYRICRHLIDHWTWHTGCKDYRIALSSRKDRSFRYQVHPHYKNQRVAKKPLAIPQMEAYLVKRHDAESRPGLEGDDLLGIWQTDPAMGATTIVSPDKDMLTIPERVFIVPHMADFDTSPIRDVSEEQALATLTIQSILGDTVDNYLGAPGIGRKKVGEWVDAEAPTWETVLDAYAWAWDKRPRYADKWVHPGDIEAEALMNWRCARILQHGDYDGTDFKLRLDHPGGADEWLSVA